MKKLFLMLAAATFAANVSAQGTVITSNKAGDNWYVGVNAGVATNVKESYDGAGNGFFKALAPTVGVRVGKNLTTVFGLAAEGNVFTQTNDKWNATSGKTFIEGLNVNLLGTFNLSNLFAGYQGQPRAFEVIALGGFGWDHAFNHVSKGNGVSSKAALDFAFNLGSAKAIQLYIEPSINYSLIQSGGSFENIKYDLNRSYLAIKAGLNYKFGNSNGTHNFATAQLRDQSEIDQLNAKINELRAESSSKDGKISAANRTISDLQAQLTACQNKPAPTAKVQVVKETTQLQPIVIFGVGKSTLDNAGYASCEMVAKYMKNHKDTKIIVKGYASPEGDAAKNQKLSEARANSVKQALVKRYKIAADRIEAVGAGATSEISEENDFNRVAMFFTK
jgi:outer membrane protein OmpA-like peptidoglycan-associated protein